MARRPLFGEDNDPFALDAPGQESAAEPKPARSQHAVTADGAVESGEGSGPAAETARDEGVSSAAQDASSGGTTTVASPTEPPAVPSAAVEAPLSAPSVDLREQSPVPQQATPVPAASAARPGPIAGPGGAAAPVPAPQVAGPGFGPAGYRPQAPAASGYGPPAAAAAPATEPRAPRRPARRDYTVRYDGRIWPDQDEQLRTTALHLNKQREKREPIRPNNLVQIALDVLFIHHGQAIQGLSEADLRRSLGLPLRDGFGNWAQEP